MKGEISSGSHGKSSTFDFLNKVDLYGYVPELLYKGKSSHSTRYGGLISIFSALGYLGVVGFTAWRYFQREAPATNIETQYVPNPPGFVWNRSNFPFAFGIEDSTEAHFVDERIYTVEATYVLKTTTSIGGKDSTSVDSIKLPLIRCSEAGLDPRYFDNLPLANLYCIREFIEPVNKLEITGRWESRKFGYMTFNFKRCNSTERECLPEDQVIQTLRNSYFGIYFIDRVLKASDFDKPYVELPRSQYMSTSIAYTKYLSYYLQENKVETDSSLIGYLQPHQQTFLSIGTQYSDMSNLAIDGKGLPDIFLNFMIRMSATQSDISRKYKNIYDYLAEFGGMAQVVAIAAIVMTFRMSRLNLIMDLARNTIDKESMYQQLIAEYVVGRDQKDKQEKNTNPESSNLKSTKTSIFGKSAKAGPFSASDTATKQRKPSVYSLVVQPNPENNSNMKLRRGSKSPEPSSAKNSHRVRGTHVSVASDNPNPRGQKYTARQVPLEMDKEPDNVAEEGKRQQVRYSSRISGNDLSKKSHQIAGSRFNATGFSRTDFGSVIDSVAKRDACHQTCELREIENDAPEIISRNQFEMTSKLDLQSQIDDANRELVESVKEFHIEERQRYEGLKKAMSHIRSYKLFLKGFMPCFTKNSRISAVSEAVENRVYSNFDFLKLIETVEEFEKLKRLMLTPEQKTLLDLIPSQRLKYDENERQFTLLRQSMTMKVGESEYRTKKLEVLKAFHTVKQVEEKSQLDKNLIKTLGFLMQPSEEGLGVDLRPVPEESYKIDPHFA